MTSQQLSVKVAVNSWRLGVERADKIFSNLAAGQLLREVAPGKNRLIYLWGHLTAIHDGLFSILGLGQRQRPELDAIFISHPDKTAAQLPSARKLKQYWDEVNAKLHAQFASLSGGMVATTLRHVRGRLCERSDRIGCTAEPNEPFVPPLGAGYSGNQVAAPDPGWLLLPTCGQFCSFWLRLETTRSHRMLI
jgi:hypothetical protein